MAKRKTKTKTGPSAQELQAAANTPNVQLTIDERDTIDDAKGRASRLARICMLILEHGDDAELIDLFEMIEDDLAAINVVFDAADKRLTDGAQ
jgi:hypothetical protein